jgi:hypothetical protein
MSYNNTESIVSKLKDQYLNVTLYMTEEIEKVRSQCKNVNVMPDIDSVDDTRLRLNVGGEKFSIGFKNALQCGLFRRLFLNKEEDGYDIPAYYSMYIFIDRDPSHFGDVCNFLRDGQCDIKDKNCLIDDARYYEIPELLTFIEEFHGKTNKKCKVVTPKNESKGVSLIKQFEDELEETTQFINSHMLNEDSKKKIETLRERNENGTIWLDVGGRQFLTTRSIVSKLPEDVVLEINSSDYFVDRNGEVFDLVLRVLRNQALPRMNMTTKKRLQKELEYYGIEYPQQPKVTVNIPEIDDNCLYNVIRTNDTYQAQDTTSSVFDKNYRTKRFENGTYYISVQVKKTPPSCDIMIGCCPGDTNVSHANIYKSIGRWFYCTNGSSYGNWGGVQNGNSSAAVTVVQEDIVSLKLDTEERKLYVFHTVSSTGETKRWTLCKDVPILDSYCFAVSMFSSLHATSIVDVPDSVLEYDE